MDISKRDFIHTYMFKALNTWERWKYSHVGQQAYKYNMYLFIHNGSSESAK